LQEMEPEIEEAFWSLSMADVLACYFAAINASTLHGRCCTGVSRAVGEYGSVVIVASIFHLKT